MFNLSKKKINKIMAFAIAFTMLFASQVTVSSVCLFNTTQRRMTAHSAIRIHVKILVYHTPQKPREVRNINIAANTILPPTSNAPFIIEKNTSPIPFNAPRII